ncbi:MAG: Fis family transcriptional regulator, partial [Treponema sp.]|nr:Fis family transcriptional regulator [Treponema sp.]
WPGNVRELENIVERSCILGHPPLIQIADLHIPSSENRTAEKNENFASSVESGLTLKEAMDEFKREYIKRILVENGWNQTETAKILDVQRTYLTRLLKELGVKRSL